MTRVMKNLSAVAGVSFACAAVAMQIGDHHHGQNMSDVSVEKVHEVAVVNALKLQKKAANAPQEPQEEHTLEEMIQHLAEHDDIDLKDFETTFEQTYKAVYGDDSNGQKEYIKKQVKAAMESRNLVEKKEEQERVLNMDLSGDGPKTYTIDDMIDLLSGNGDLTVATLDATFDDIFKNMFCQKIVDEINEKQNEKDTSKLSLKRN